MEVLRNVFLVFTLIDPVPAVGGVAISTVDVELAPAGFELKFAVVCIGTARAGLRRGCCGVQTCL